MENPGKKVIMESHGKVMENSKTSDCHGNLFARKKVMEKSWKSVVQIRLIVFPSRMLRQSLSLKTRFKKRENPIVSLGGSFRVIWYAETVYCVVINVDLDFIPRCL